MNESLTLLRDSLDDRELISVLRLSVATVEGHAPLDSERIIVAPGRISLADDHLRIDYPAPEAAGESLSRIVRVMLPDTQMASGYGIQLRLRGWESLSYIAIGHPEAGAYIHVKARNTRQDHWFDFDIGFRDVAWGWGTGWKYLEDRPINEVRLYIKGVPGPEAGSDIRTVRVWQEISHPLKVFGEDCFVKPEVVEALFEYQRMYFPEFKDQACAFMDEGLCPLTGQTLLDWYIGSELPARLHDNGTWQYSWHSLHPAVILMLLAENENTRSDRGAAAMMAARDFVTDWLGRNHEHPEANIKYAWYDHGVAERVLTLLMLYGAGQKSGFDVRFMARLRRAILRHGQFLASEVFYSGHQPTRYHNHAWFQDLALIAIALFFPGWTCTARWGDLALARITDQFDRLIVNDGDFAVFAENSVGYHFGIERLVANMGRLARLSDRASSIETISSGLSRFTALIRYPGGKRALGQGDTFRLPNAPEGDASGRQPYPVPEATILPKAGYAVAKGNHGSAPFMLVFLATSRIQTHKHADNLSFTLYMDGIEWLIDPSFVSHEYTNPVPAYLRSAPAHNALVLPDHPYSIAPGLARLWGVSDDEAFTFEGNNDAVSGLRFTRRIVGSLTSLHCAFSDQLVQTVESGKLHETLSAVRLMFHCGEGVEAELLADDAGVALRHPASHLGLRICLPPGCRTTLIRGHQDHPVRGVAGLGFLQQVAITTIEIALPSGVNELDWTLSAL
jgi:hypothetical protein